MKTVLLPRWIAVCLLLGAAGVLDADQEYVREDIGFRLTAPPGWQLRNLPAPDPSRGAVGPSPGAPELLALFEGAPREGAQGAALRVWFARGAKDLDEICQGFAEHWDRTGGRVQITEKFPCTVDGRAGIRLTGSTADGFWHHATLVSAPLGVLVLDFLCPLEASTPSERLFDGTVRSVRWTLRPSAPGPTLSSGGGGAGEARREGRLETEHYEVLYKTERAQAEFLAGRLERIFPKYEELFGPARTRDSARRHRVRVFASRDEFESYCGFAQASRGAVGLFHPEFREVVCCLEDSNPNQPTYRVLYHEAMHQYVAEVLPPEIALPIWLNEGLGEYFFAAEEMPGPPAEALPARPNLGIATHRSRLARIRKALQEGSTTPLGIFLALSKERFYEKADLHYAEAWSLVYFLLESSGTPYRGVLARYLGHLREGTKPGEAFQRTVGQLDLGKLERDWAAFVEELSQKMFRD